MQNLTIEQKPAAPESKVRTGGELFMRILQEDEVPFVFGTTGAGMAEIQDAMVMVKPPKWIMGLHEFTTVNAAAGYALASESLGAALIDRNVGTQNAAGAFYCAYMNMAPIAVFASKNVAGVPVPTGQVEYHYMNYEGTLVEPWIKWNTQNESLETLAYDVVKAIFMATAEPWGTTYLTLRQDLMAQKLPSEFGAKHLECVNQTRLPQNSPRLLDDATVKKIYDAIMNYANPEIVVSHLGRRKAGYRALLDFAHIFGLPVRDFRAFLNFPITDALHVGFPFLTQPPCLMPDVDLAVTLELGLLPHQRFGDADAIDLTSDLLHRQDVPGGGEYGSTLFPAVVRGVCDVAPTLDKITEYAQKNMTLKQKELVAERAERAAQEHNRIFGAARRKAKQSYDQGKLDASSVGYVLNEKWPCDGIWVDGSITPRNTLLQLVELKDAGTYFSNPSFHLGAVVGMAYGAALGSRKYVDVEDHGNYLIGKLSHQDRAPHPVICTTGDGDAIFGNLPSALWTCSHYGLGVLYVILNNACWGVEWSPIEKATEHWAKNAHDFEFLDLERPQIDYTAMAAAFSVLGCRVETPQQFEYALEEGIAMACKNKPMVIDVMLDKPTGPEHSVVP
ncbi:MAG: thiamine pyrophosphate-binding protein [Candidatus Bathyarchaeota archaeon]|nr:thiamine pyrophosphate-binding protein [Candidatus Bathyarchaeota archaeon]